MIQVLRHQNKLNHRKPARRDEFSACGAQYHTPLISESGAQSPDNVNCNKCVPETRLTRVQERADLINWQEFRGSEIVDVEQRKDEAEGGHCSGWRWKFCEAEKRRVDVFLLFFILVHTEYRTTQVKEHCELDWFILSYRLVYPASSSSSSVSWSGWPSDAWLLVLLRVNNRIYPFLHLSSAVPNK